MKDRQGRHKNFMKKGSICHIETGIIFTCQPTRSKLMSYSHCHCCDAEVTMPTFHDEKAYCQKCYTSIFGKKPKAYYVKVNVHPDYEPQSYKTMYGETFYVGMFYYDLQSTKMPILYINTEGAVYK